MAIVLPESILNTKQMQYVRDFIDCNAHVLAVFSLPPQTFAPFDGVGKSSVLFLEKTQPARDAATFFVASTNLGYDNTGRHVSHNDLPAVIAEFQNFEKKAPRPTPFSFLVKQSEVISNLSFVSARNSVESTEETLSLEDLCHQVMCGRTPPKSDYTTSGARILKVGDLTGEGIDWAPRERSFVVPELAAGRRNLFVREQDILLTAAAHHPRYIGQKVDIVDYIPREYKEIGATFAAELLLIRINAELWDPFVALMWLRSKSGYEALQGCVTGQTAHIYPDAVRKIKVPKRLLSPSASSLKGLELLKASLKLRRKYKEAFAEGCRLFGEDS